MLQCRVSFCYSITVCFWISSFVNWDMLIDKSCWSISSSSSDIDIAEMCINMTNDTSLSVLDNLLLALFLFSALCFRCMVVNVKNGKGNGAMICHVIISVDCFKFWIQSIAIICCETPTCYDHDSYKKLDPWEWRSYLKLMKSAIFQPKRSSVKVWKS